MAEKIDTYYIGITGKMGAGKTTLATYMCDYWNSLDSKNQSFIVPFVQQLKSFAKMLGWNGEKDEKGRKLLQLLGTECGRMCIDPDIWVKHWEDYVWNLPITDDSNILVIADDTRFDNEVTHIKSKTNSMIIKIIGRHDPLLYKFETHASESGINSDFINHIIINSKELSDLQNHAKDIICQMI